jgi:hypothetical protein
MQHGDEIMSYPWLQSPKHRCRRFACCSKATIKMWWPAHSDTITVLQIISTFMIGYYVDMKRQGTHDDRYSYTAWLWRRHAAMVTPCCTIHCPIRTIPSELLLSGAVTPTFISHVHRRSHLHIQWRPWQTVSACCWTGTRETRLAHKKETWLWCSCVHIAISFTSRNELTIPYTPHSAACQIFQIYIAIMRRDCICWCPGKS